MLKLPRGYLSKKHGRWRPLRLLDVAVLLFNVHKGATDAEVGFEDCRETLDTFTRKLNKYMFVDPMLLESALWSCNLLDEHGRFWHPQGLTFEEFLKKVVRRGKFNRTYNVIENEENKL